MSAGVLKAEAGVRLALPWDKGSRRMSLGYYYIRGLKVMNDNYWCSWSQKYVPREDGARRGECTFRTAVEPVGNSDIERLFV